MVVIVRLNLTYKEDIMKKIVTIGEYLIDMMPTLDGYKPKPGGAPMNVAVAIHRLNGHVLPIAQVGNDFFGQMRKDTLVQEGFKLISSGASAILIKRGLEKACDALVKELYAQSSPLQEEDDVAHLAAASASGDQEIGKIKCSFLERRKTA